MLSWNDEMDAMLASVDRQVKHSLKNIKMALKQHGLSFNAEFKQYLVRALHTRVNESCDQFEVISMLEDYDNIGAYRTSSNETYHEMNDTTSNDTNNAEHEIDDPVEIIDSEDEGDQPGYRIKLESLKELYAIQGDGTPFELNHVDDFDIEGSSIEIDNTTEVNEIEAGRELPANIFNGRTTRKIPTNENSISRNKLAMKKRFKCELCQYSSDFEWNVKSHMRIHTGKKPYRCDICHKEFTHSRDMKRHKVIHTNEIPFHCRGCLTGFLQKEEREAHEKVCKYRRYECHLCKKCVTDRKHNFMKHMRIHSGEKPFRCEICMKHFTQKSHLTTHLDTIHTKINP